MSSDFAAYCFYVNRLDLLKRAIVAFPDLLPELTIVDNSVDGLKPMPGYVRMYRPPVPLTYTQSMNWMLRDAGLRGGVDFILHFHSDAASTNPLAVQQLLDYVRALKANGNRWGCAWTFYDILWAINPVAAREVGGWDTNFAAYFSDQDMRRLWTLAGWECIDTHIPGVTHEGSATIRSDPKLEFLNSVTFPLFQNYYRQKWGGDPGQEKFGRPFNGVLD